MASSTTIADSAGQPNSTSCSLSAYWRFGRLDVALDRGHRDAARRHLPPDARLAWREDITVEALARGCEQCV